MLRVRAWRGERNMVPDEGIEPPTFGLQNRCSTAELIRPMRRVPWLAAPFRRRKARSAAGRDRRRPRALDRDGLVHAGPGRHGDGDEGERAVALGAELERGPERDRHRQPGRQRFDAFLRPGAPPQSKPRPATTYQISSTVRCVTACETAPAGSSKCAKLPPSSAGSSRTAVPSGAVASGSAARALVAKGRGWASAAPVGASRSGSAWRGARRPAKRSHEYGLEQHDLNRRSGA